MARFATLSPSSVLAWSALAAFFVIMFAALAVHKNVGAWPYLFGLFAFIAGAVVKEDSVPILAVAGLSLLVILDITEHIALLP